MTRALIGLDGPFDPATEAFMGDDSVRIEAFVLRSRMRRILLMEEPSPIVRDALRTTAEALGVLYAQTWKARALPAHNPLATRCGGSPGCDTVFDAPADVKVGDVLTCPTCGARSRVIDTGRGAGVEYIRARGEPQG